MKSYNCQIAKVNQLATSYTVVVGQCIRTACSYTSKESSLRFNLPDFLEVLLAEGLTEEEEASVGVDISIDRLALSSKSSNILLF